jgi:hypothetical protein
MQLAVTATPTIQNGAVTSWQLCTPSGCASGPSFPLIDIPTTTNQTSAQVTISINDPTGLITFAAGQNAMSVQAGFTCPGQIGSWNPGSQLSGFTRVSNTQIQFSDANSNMATNPLYFAYKLNFTNTSNPNQTVPFIDPIIRNGGHTTAGLGGPGALTQKDILIDAAIVSFIVALIVAVIVARVVGVRVAH